MITINVSVIMPCFNGTRFLRDAIRSILDQTYPHFEFLIIDDGSTDESLQIMKEFAEKDHRIMILQNPETQGVAASLNRGLECARGEFIARMDADDIARSNRFEAQVDFLRRHSEYIVCGSAIDLIDEHGALIKKRIYFSEDDEIKKDLMAANPFAHPSVMIRAAALEAGLFSYDPRKVDVEDYDLWIRMAPRGKYYNLPIPLLSYRISKQAIKSAKTKRMLLNTICLKLSYWGRLSWKAWGILILQILLLLLPSSWVVFLFIKAS